MGRLDGVDKVAVSLTREQALVDYDPARIRPEQIAATLRDIGIRPLRPARAAAVREEEAQLVREGVQLLAAVSASLAAIGLIAAITGIWPVLVPASVVAVMVPVLAKIADQAGARTMGSRIRGAVWRLDQARAACANWSGVIP